jgi:hypothetical protein
MNARALGACLTRIGLLWTAGVACGSASSTPGPVADGASPRDSSHEAATPDASAADAGPDAGPTDAAPESDVAIVCMGLDATAAQVGFPPLCEACMAANCCTPYETCFNDPGCKAVEICTGNCIEQQGMSPLTCATQCAADTDSGPVKAEAQGLNACIVSKCPTPCTP